MANTLSEFYASLSKPLPTVQQRQGDALKAGIQNYSGTAQQNTQLLNFLQGTQNGTNQQPINASSLGGNTALNIPQQIPSTDPNAVIAGLTPTLIGFNNVDTSKPGALDQINSQLNQMGSGQLAAQQRALQLQGKLGTEASETAKFNEQFGANTLRDTITKMGKEAIASQQRYLAEQVAVAGRPIGLERQGGKLDQLRRRQAIDVLSQSATLALVQGDYQVAQDRVKDAIAMEFEPIKNELETQEMFLKFNSENMDRGEKQQAQAQQLKIDEAKMRLQSQIELATYREKAKIDAAAMGAGVENFTPMAPATYTIKDVDLLQSDTGNVSQTNLQQIAKGAGLSMDQLLAANPNLSSGKVKPGMVLNLPSVSNPNPSNGSILSATGLSSLQMNYMTQGTSALTRLNQASREAVIASSDAWARTHGTDTATIQAQYEAYNKTLQQNIMRNNNTKIAEQELLGTIANLTDTAATADLGKISAKNAAKLWTDQQFNDPVATRYAVHLNQLRTELAYYNAAVSGNTQADDANRREAEQIIKNGLASGGLEGMKNAIESSTSKMGAVLQNSVDYSSKSVWNLFGVGDKYQSQYGSTGTIDNGNLWSQFQGLSGAGTITPTNAINFFQVK